MRLDLPLPETPVTTVSVPSGISAVTSLRLWPRAPSMRIAGPLPGRRSPGAGVGTLRAPVR